MGAGVVAPFCLGFDMVSGGFDWCCYVVER